MNAPRLDEGLTRPIPDVTDLFSFLAARIPLAGRRVLDVGCGRAEMTRRLVADGGVADVLALEVDEVQHAHNLATDDLPTVRFALGGAERIPARDDEFDVVFLFKSLHHVPVDRMDRALDEVARVLRADGRACICEPLFRGAFNDVLRIFHDEQRVRRAAFEAIERAVAAGRLRSVAQLFVRTPVTFADFAEFERLILGATHTHHALDDEQLQSVRAAFASHAAEDGSARFEQPIRIDLLALPGA